MINLGWFLLSIFVLIIILAIGEKKFNFKENKLINIAVNLSLFFVGLILISVLMTGSIKEERIVIDTNIRVENLLSLNDNYSSNTNGNIHGALTFFYGEIRESKDLYYRVLIGDDKKGYTIKDIKIDNNVRLFFTDSKEFRLEYYYDIISENYIPNWYYGGIFKTFHGYEEHTKLTNCKIYLPKDAIKIDLTVDLK